MENLDNIKFIIYDSDRYYPGVKEFTSYVDADKAFSKLRSDRLSEIKYNNDPLCDTDYLCIVISEIDIKKLLEIKKLGDGLDERTE